MYGCYFHSEALFHSLNYGAQCVVQMLARLYLDPLHECAQPVLFFALYVSQSRHTSLRVFCSNFLPPDDTVIYLVCSFGQFFGTGCTFHDQISKEIPQELSRLNLEQVRISVSITISLQYFNQIILTLNAKRFYLFFRNCKKQKVIEQCLNCVKNWIKHIIF